MSTLEQELIEKITRLDAENQRKVLEFVERIETLPAQNEVGEEASTEDKIYTLEELMKLPFEKRDRRVKEALARSRDEDFEIFEANSENNLREEKVYTALDLMKLPFEERNRIAIAALQRSLDQDVELFEAFGENDLVDD